MNFDKYAWMILFVLWVLGTATLGMHLAATGGVGDAILAVILSFFVPVLALLLDSAKLSGGCFILLVSIVWLLVVMWASISVLAPILSVFFAIIVVFVLVLLFVWAWTRTVTVIIPA